ncbi:MAG: polyphosphate kinase 1 [Pseudomonadales bacterium]|jgi:polyphosphate kinase|nr:polyphosphate kinase 1 [Pseudomonadales bacterium]
MSESATGSERSARYLNRELSDLQFIERVLEEARNPRHPLLERLRFLAISARVLDQYFSVRIAKLERSADRADGYVTPDGMTPADQLDAVLRAANVLAAGQEAVWLDLREALAAAGIELRTPDALEEDVARRLENWFAQHAAPVLTPSIVDAEHPFPYVASDDLCALLEFEERFVLVPLPRSLPRFVPLPGDACAFVLLEDLLRSHARRVLPADGLRECGVFQVLRDNALAKQDHTADLLAVIESSLRRMHLAHATKLKVSERISAAGIRFLARHLDLLHEAGEALELANAERIEVRRMPALADLDALITPRVEERFPELLFPPHRPIYPPALLGADCFDVIRDADVLVHWPYEAFDSVVDFLRRAATDPHVLAIKQTLYRTSDDSPVVAALVEAAQRGKAVTTVIELEARENESSNVRLARVLESAGVHVVYGIVGLKIHCKATLVVRREGEETRSYTHLSSGNYHPGNARIYTDLSVFSAEPRLGRDVVRVFNYITAGTLADTERLLVAPKQLRAALRTSIDREIAVARSGGPARIVAKLNALTDPEIVEQLYAASEAGVDIDLIVRRHCALRPGVPGLSSRIRVKSIVGRFLEHSRILVFGNGGTIDGPDATVLIGSADLMERNLDDRVELFLPVEDPAIRRRIVTEIVGANLRDERQSWSLRPDGSWVREGNEGFCAQSHFAGA